MTGGFKYRHIKFADGTEATVKDTADVHIFVQPDDRPEATVTVLDHAGYAAATANPAKPKKVIRKS